MANTNNESSAGTANTYNCFGMVVAPTDIPGGGHIYAEVVPAPWKVWRPWKHRTSRWWYEVRGVDADGDSITYAYESGGSGGGFTLARCIVRAGDAVDAFAHALPKNGSGEPPAMEGRSTSVEVAVQSVGRGVPLPDPDGNGS